MTARRVVAPRVVAAALLALLAGGACGDDDGGSSGRSSVAGLPARDVDAAVRGLCRARAEAGTDVKSARTTFYDRSHGPLHDIARALEPVDHQQAALLLEAKATVEAHLDAEPAGPSLTAAVDRLLQVTRASLTRLSATPPPCP